MFKEIVICVSGGINVDVVRRAIDRAEAQA
jgi:hypothetical protein